MTRPRSGLDNGFYLTPATFCSCSGDMNIVQKEVFGMLMSVLSFHDEEEVIYIANSTQFGLTAGIFTNDIKRGHQMVHRLEVGNIWINNYNLGSVELPWGGYRNSCVGRGNGSQDASF